MADGASQTEVVTDPALDETRKRMKTRRTWLLRLFLIVVLAGGATTAWYMLSGSKTVSTENAYIGAEMAEITPQISAPVTEVLVSETDAVKEGDVLVRLDTGDAEIAIAEAKADLASAQRRFRQAEARNSALEAQILARQADIGSAQADLTSIRSTLEKAQIDFDRREALSDTGAVSGEELTAAQQALEAAKAAEARALASVRQAQAGLVAAQGELAANQALTDGVDVETDPAVLKAKARLSDAEGDLENAVIRAPIDGVVARRRVQIGQRVAQGAPIMTIIPLNDVYVDANFKESQLRKVRVGMPATITADIYGSNTEYHGRVIGFAGATGSSMALIPAQNATGNWIKVVQRLPVRIELDPKELAANPLRVGLSAEVEIHLDDE